MAKCSLAIIVVIAFQAFSGINARPDNYHPSEKELTKLNEIGVQWKEVLNLEKKPCDDFYDFVCTDKKHPKQKGTNESVLLEDVFNSNPELATETEQKYLKFSSKCKTIKPEEEGDFLKWFKLNKSIGEWPALNKNWDESDFNLPLAISEMCSYNYPVVFRQLFRWNTDSPYESEVKIITEDSVSIHQNENLFKQVFKNLGVTNPEEVLADAALFETTFNEATESAPFSADIKIKYSELTSHFPDFDFAKHIEVTYGQNLPDDYSVRLASPEKLKKGYLAISKLSPKIIANYFFCVFLYKTSEITSTKPDLLFKPVYQAAIIKHLFKGNSKEIVKGMLITILDYIRETFKAECSSEQIAEFVTQDIFGVTNEENLAEEFKEVSANDNECMKNFHFLQRIQNNRLAKPGFNCKNRLLTEIKDDMANHVQTIASLSEQPSPFIFEYLIFAILPSATDYYNKINGFGFTTAQRECFAKHFTNEVTTKDMNIMLGTQLMLNVYSNWINNYPSIVEEENKVLQPYGLSAEKLHVLSMQKYFCEQVDSFDAVLTAVGNLVEYSQMYDCPAGSKLNAAKKCTLWQG